MDDLALSGEQQPNRFEQRDLGFVASDVVEGECRKHQIIAAGLQAGQIVARNQAIISFGIDLASFANHLFGYINAGDLKPELAQETRRSAGATAKIYCPETLYVLPNDGRQVAKGEVISILESQCGVSIGAS